MGITSAFLSPVALRVGKKSQAGICSFRPRTRRRCVHVRDPVAKFSPGLNKSPSSVANSEKEDSGGRTPLPNGSRVALASSFGVFGLGAILPYILSQLNGVSLESYGSHYTMLLLLLGFAGIHSGLASFRPIGAKLIGERLYRVLFAFLSLPSAGLTISYFIAHRYDGVHNLWSFQGVPFVHEFVWILTALSFLLLYPATFDLPQVAAVKRPTLTIFERGVIRITRHPQLWGQVLWCISHCLWIGSSFSIVVSCGLISHHLFGVWNGDRRLNDRFGETWETFSEKTSIIPFAAILDGKQEVDWSEFGIGYVGVLAFVTAAYASHPAVLRMVGQLNL